MSGIWPNNIKCVALLTFDIDGPTAAMNMVPDAINMPSLMSMGEYGPRVATPRILDLLDDHDIKASFFIPGYVAENHEELVRDIAERGHEIGHHGYIHEPPASLTPDEEWQVLEKGIAILERITGGKPLGYRSPAWELSRYSLEYLADLDFKYDASLMGDDAPYVIDTAKGPIVELPSHWLLDDFPYFAFIPAQKFLGPPQSPNVAYESWAAEFNGLYRYGRTFHLTMHPQVIGRPGRLLMLERLIEYIKTFPDVVFMRAIDLAEMWVS